MGIIFPEGTTLHVLPPSGINPRSSRSAEKGKVWFSFCIQTNYFQLSALNSFQSGDTPQIHTLESETVSSIPGQHTGDLRIEKWNQWSVKYGVFELWWCCQQNSYLSLTFLFPVSRAKFKHFTYEFCPEIGGNIMASSRARITGFKSLFCRLLVLWPWTNQNSFPQLGREELGLLRLLLWLEDLN